MKAKRDYSCICEWPDECDGGGMLDCDGCSGDTACWCRCGGSRECGGCSACEEDFESDDFTEEDPA